MAQVQSKYDGFINNYIAGNLEANSTELNLHSSKINELLRDLEIEIKKGGFNSPDTLCQNIRKTSLENTGINSEAEYKTLGANIKTFISLLVDQQGGKEIPSYATFLIKKIIYHFLNIAKTSKLSDIEKIGIEIADKFKESGTIPKT